MFGIFEHRPLDPLHAIFRGFDDMFYVPHSRHTEVRKEDILKVPELTLLSESEDAGVHLVVARGGREFLPDIRNTLHSRWIRNIAGMWIKVCPLKYLVIIMWIMIRTEV